MGISGGAGRGALGPLIWGSELGARGLSLGGEEGPRQGREWASHPRIPQAGGAQLPAVRAPGAGRGPGAASAPRGAWARDPDWRSPTPILPPTPHTPALSPVAGGR